MGSNQGQHREYRGEEKGKDSTQHFSNKENVISKKEKKTQQAWWLVLYERGQRDEGKFLPQNAFLFLYIYYILNNFNNYILIYTLYTK